MRRRWARLALLIFTLSLAAPATCASQQRPSPQHPFGKLTPDDAATREGFNYFYNLDYVPAIADFEKSLSEHPNSPYAVNHLLEGVLFQELHREGKLDAELYLSNEFVHARKEQAPTPQTAARIQKLVNQALGIEAKQLAANPKDVSALYARSVTLGLRAVDQGLLDKAWLTALRSGLSAYDDSKEALEIDPAETDPRLIVGIYNYVVGSLPWPVKIAAFLATIHGSKSKGLALIRQAADGGGEASIDARTTLGLFLARDHHYQEALDLTKWLYAAFPHNFLFGLSVADLLKADGKPTEATAAYRQLIELGKQGWFPNEDVGLAATELGNLLRSKHDWQGAAEAYESVGSLPNRDQALWLRAELAAGQMYDRAGQRQLAVKNYREVANGSDDSKLTEKAQRFLKHPYKGD
jgi:hypothetical protein